MEQHNKQPTAGSWKPGTSGNLHGRPRSGLALAEAIRSRVDPHEVMDLLIRHLRDEEVPIEKRLAVALPWMQAGFLKPPTATAIDLRTTVTALPAGWAAMPIEQRRAYLDDVQRGATSSITALALAVATDTTDA